MRTLVINPNTTASMTEKIGAAARAVASAGTQIVAVNPSDGPASIANLAQSLSDRFGVPVLDGVACAVKLAEALVGIGLKTSKLRAYASPLPNH